MENYKIGDVLYAAGGYNRTDVEFYEVTGMTEKRLELTELESNVVSGDPIRVCYVEPTSKKTDKTEKAFISKRGYLRIIGRTKWEPRTLYKYEGKPIWSNTGYQC